MSLPVGSFLEAEEKPDSRSHRKQNRNGKEKIPSFGLDAEKQKDGGRKKEGRRNFVGRMERKEQCEKRVEPEKYREAAFARTLPLQDGERHEIPGWNNK